MQSKNCLKPGKTYIKCKLKAKTNKHLKRAGITQKIWQRFWLETQGI